MADKTIDLKVYDKTNQANFHMMPCRIENTELNVKAKEYFWPLVKPLIAGGDEEQGREKDHSDMSAKSNKDSDNPILTASYRGRPLQGRKVKLPDGYKGVAIASDSRGGKILKRKFDHFTYWNWDELPTDKDAPASALQWISIANAVHGDPDETN